MEIINFSEQNTVMNLYLAELRDRKYQQNHLLFRNNIVRMGEMMAYELSKRLDYKTVTTPLGTIDIFLPKDDLVIATVLRAGLPFHQGFLNVFDHAENAFVSAYRMYTNREHTEVGVHAEYMASPSVKGKTLVIVDPMLATGGSAIAAIQFLKGYGCQDIKLMNIIAAPEGIRAVREAHPDIPVFCGCVDEKLNDKGYILPGLGDAGDRIFNT